MKTRFFGVFLFSFFLLFLGFVNATNVLISTSENSSVISLINGGFSIDSIGTLIITNPTNYTIYNFEIPLNLDSLVGVSKKSIDNTSSKFFFNFNKIYGFMIKPNQTIKTGYRIYGLSSYNPYLKMKTNESLFKFYSGNFKFYSGIILHLEFPQRQGYIYNLNGSKNSSAPLTSKREISLNITNPTDFNYFASSIQVYRTNNLNPFYNNYIPIKSFYNKSIKPFSSLQFDFFDDNSFSGAVYWLSSEVSSKYNFTSNVKKHYSVQKSPIVSSGGGGGGSGGFSGISYWNFSNSSLSNISISKIKPFLNTILLKKKTNISILTDGSLVRVSLEIVNTNSFSFNNLTLYDFIPNGFSLVNTLVQGRIFNSNGLKFSISKILPYSTKVVSYTLKRISNISGVSYLRPAQLTYNKNQTIFSLGVLLVNNFLPNKKLFVQKMINNFYLKGFSKITIIVKNLGETSLNNILISDNLGEDSLIKDISKVFYEKKGVWKIKELGPTSQWEVSYLVANNNKVNSLPNIYGIGKLNVYRTLVTSGQINTIISQKPGVSEKVGLGVAIFLLILYLIF